MLPRLNRTFMELKPEEATEAASAVNGLNRTFMELKLEFRCAASVNDLS